VEEGTGGDGVQAVADIFADICGAAGVDNAAAARLGRAVGIGEADGARLQVNADAVDGAGDRFGAQARAVLRAAVVQRRAAPTSEPGRHPGAWQMPLEHENPDAHALPQPPQLLASVLKSG
jgi:hypothetical protein